MSDGQPSVGTGDFVGVMQNWPPVVVNGGSAPPACSVICHSVLPCEKSPLVMRFMGGGHTVPGSVGAPVGPCPAGSKMLAYTLAPPDAAHATIAIPFLATASCRVRTLVA